MKNFSTPCENLDVFDLLQIQILAANILVIELDTKVLESIKVL